MRLFLGASRLDPWAERQRRRGFFRFTTKLWPQGRNVKKNIGKMLGRIDAKVRIGATEAQCALRGRKGWDLTGYSAALAGAGRESADTLGP